MTIWDELYPITMNLYGRVLDACCGNGEYTRLLRQIPMMSEVVGLDVIDRNSIVWGKSFAELNPNSKYLQLSITDMATEPDGSYDSILCWHGLEHTSKPRLALKEFKRVLKKSGLFMLSFPRHVGDEDRVVLDRSDDPETHKFSWSDKYMTESLTKVGFVLTSNSGAPFVDSTGGRTWLLTNG
jgi:ubiquinone/menaquinone biosynthesis C-methylase UbiE